MATESYSIVQGSDQKQVLLVQWTVGNGDDGTPFWCPELADKSIHVSGTFGSGGTVVLEGSNLTDHATYGQLHRPDGNNLSFTSEGIYQCLENCAYIRPRVTAGDGTTAIVVTLCLSRRRR